MKTYTIDCDAKPKIPYPGWTIESHQKGGKIKWNPDNFALYLDEAQKSGYIQGHELRKKLEGKPVLNACVGDFLEKRPELVPESWKKNENGNTLYFYFWGTIFRLSDGYLCVRCWCWFDGRLVSRYSWLDDGWGDQYPALVLASAQNLKTKPSDTLNLELRIERLERFYEKAVELMPSLQDITEQ